MILPFEPLSIAFKDVHYYVDTPPVSTHKFLTYLSDKLVH